MSEVSPNRCSTHGSSRNASVTAENAPIAPHMKSRATAANESERVRSHARIPAVLAIVIVKNARPKCQRCRRRATEYTAVTPPSTATGTNGPGSSPTDITSTTSTSV